MSAAEDQHDWILAQAEELRAQGETEPRRARDPVNQPQVHSWLEAIGDTSPIYRDTPEARTLHGGPVAPPAMAQVWTMYGLDPHRPSGDPLHAMMGALDDAGFTSVLGTNCDQTYQRYLRPGEHVAVTTALESVVGPKRTAVGEGYFVTTRSVWRVGDEEVASMLFRVLKFAPGTGRTAPAAAGDRAAQELADGADRVDGADGADGANGADPARTVRPVVNRDTAYFWEGTTKGELRIQRCDACGELRHPPGPMCPVCGKAQRGYVVAAGHGRVHSYVVHHAPPIPGKTLPMVLALVDLDEGVRMIGEVRGIAVGEVDDSLIGQAVSVDFDRIDDELTLPIWRLEGPEVDVGAAEARAGLSQTDRLTTRDSPRHADASAGGRPLSSVHNPALHQGGLPGWELHSWELPITTTLVVSTALATRDFQDVHHDRDLAVQRGSKDIFLNILTTTGLVQRYVTAWAGPAALIRSCELRLGAPAHPGDTLSFTGEVADVLEVDTRAGPERRHLVEVTGTVAHGTHVTARVAVVLPEEGPR